MSNCNIVVAATVVTLLSGCASVTGSKLQPVSVQTVMDNKEVSGVGCILANDAGKWFVTSPGSTTIQKSTADLMVDCSNDKVGTGHETIVSKANGGVWGNIILGGGIGYVVDRNTGAGFDYPPMITVVLHKIEQALGVTEKAGEKTAETSTTEQADKPATVAKAVSAEVAK